MEDLEAISARLCIGIPATYEGPQACKVLENRGIRTMATGVFTLEQAWMAGEVGCAYIAPHIDDLRIDRKHE